MSSCRAFALVSSGFIGLGEKKYLLFSAAILLVFFARRGLSADSPRKDVRALSQHFLDPSGKTAPWMFVPAENIARLSTAEHPGVVTIWEAGRGKDIKGL